MTNQLRETLSCVTNLQQLPTNTASTKSHASGKSKNPYYRILGKGSDVFFGADTESPQMTQGKNATLMSYRQITAFIEVT